MSGAVGSERRDRDRDLEKAHTVLGKINSLLGGKQKKIPRLYNLPWKRKLHIVS